MRGIEEQSPPRFARDESDVEQLVFALKYDGIDLTMLGRIFDQIDVAELVAAVEAKPTSAYLRQIWFFTSF